MNLQKLKEIIGENERNFIKNVTDLRIGQPTDVFGVLVTVIQNERDNEYMECVFKIEESYFRMLGSYDSWNGTTWDYCDIEQVIPKDVVITTYVTI